MLEDPEPERSDQGPLAIIVRRLQSQLLLAAIAFGLVFAAVASEPLAWTVPGIFVFFGTLDTVVVLRRLSRKPPPVPARGSVKIGDDAVAGVDIFAMTTDPGGSAEVGERPHAGGSISAQAGSRPPQLAYKAPPTAPALPARRGTSLFIGREALLAEAVALLDTRSTGVLLDVSGVHGVGKSTFLIRLIEEAELRGIRVYQRDLVEGRIDERPEVPLDALNETLVLTSRLIKDIASSFDDAGLRSVVPAYDADVGTGRVGNLNVMIGQGAKAGRDIVATATVGGEATRLATIERRDRLADLFVTAWSRFTARGPALLVFDSFELVADEQTGHWLSSLFLRLPNTVVAVSRLSTQRQVCLDSPHLHSLELVNFTRDETWRYLDHLAGSGRPAAVPPTWIGELADLVYTYTQGYPTAVALVAEYALGSGGSSTAIDLATLRRELSSLDGSLSDRVAYLVELVLRPITNPLVRDVMNAAAVTTRFTRPMVAGLVDSDESDERFAEAMSQLRKLRLLRAGLGPSRQEWFRLHTYVREALAGQLRSSQPAKWRQLNHKAAQYCFEQLNEISDTEGQSAGAYGSWYKYENPAWQYYEQEWLYYTAKTGGNVQLAHARITEVFLDAFWWWGCYYPFPYNRHLIEDWDQFVCHLPPGSERTAGQRLRDVLIRLLELYPLGHRKSDAPWDEIFDDLLLLEDLCGAKPGGARLAGTERAGALINLFLAHTRRFRDPHDPRADRYYEAAVAGFEELGDQWVVAWLLEERADLELERGLVGEALVFVDRSASLAVELAVSDGEWDHELLANLHRITADVHWAKGEQDTAAAFYATALLEAYWMQGDPHPPDGYTALFYTEIAGRVAERLRELAARAGTEQALRFAAAATPDPLRVLGRPGESGLMEAIAAPGEPALLIAALLSPPPASVTGDDPAFMRLWRRHSREMTPSEQTCGRLRLSQEQEREPLGD